MPKSNAKKIFATAIFGVFFFLSASHAATISCEKYGGIVHYMNDVECLTSGGNIVPGSEVPADYDPTNPQATKANSGSQQTAKAADTPSLLNGIKPGSSGIQEYIQSIYIFAIGMVGIIATVVIMIGGLIWISSLGNAARVSSAKEWIGAAVSGLALALFSYMILFIINPDLVEFKPLNPAKVIVKEVPSNVDPEGKVYINGCCQVQSNMCTNTTSYDCNKYGGSFTSGGSCQGNACTAGTVSQGTASPNNGDCNEKNCNLACRPPSKDCEAGICVSGSCECSGCKAIQGQYSTCTTLQDCKDVCPRMCTGIKCVSNPNSNNGGRYCDCGSGCI